MGAQHTQRLEIAQGFDGAMHLAPRTHAAQQHQHRRDHASHQQYRHGPADRLRPVVILEQHERMPCQHQIRNGQPLVRAYKPVIRKALHEGQHHQHQRGIEGPLAQRLGQPALRAQPLLQRQDLIRAATVLLPAAAAHRPLQPAPAHHPLGALRPPPVQHAGHQRRDTQPLVQAVHLVEPVQRTLQPTGADRQHHGQAHGAKGDHAAVLHEHGTERKVPPRFGKQRVCHQPQAGQQHQAAPQRHAYPFHCMHPFVYVLDYSSLAKQHEELLKSLIAGPWIGKIRLSC